MRNVLPTFHRWCLSAAAWLGCNVIDGPALQWLSKQPKPRIWVSDGQVTGVQDRMSAINSLECEGLTRRHQINQEQNMNAAVKLLARLGRPRS